VQLCEARQVYAPGESPFHVRGSTYLGMRDHVKANIPGGMDAVANALPDGPHREFVRQMFLAVGWYDALPIRPITEVIAKLERRPWDESVRARAQQVAVRDLTIIHRVLLAASSPERVVEKLQRAALQYFDFGQTEIVDNQPGQSKFVLRGVPQPLGAWFLPMLDGYAGTLIARAGGKNPTVTGRLIPRGREDRIGLVDVHVDVVWGR
jgi:hypothetical protein